MFHKILYRKKQRYGDLYLYLMLDVFSSEMRQLLVQPWGKVLESVKT